MAKLKQQLLEDRALRNAARSIILDQFLRVREAASGKRLGTQLADKVGDEAFDLADRAEAATRGRGGLIAAIAGLACAAAALWFAREPIAALLGAGKAAHDEAPDQPEELDDNSFEYESQTGDLP